MAREVVVRGGVEPPTFRFSVFRFVCGVSVGITGRGRTCGDSVGPPRAAAGSPPPLGEPGGQSRPWLLTVTRGSAAHEPTMALPIRNGRRVVAGGRLSRAGRVLVGGGHRAPAELAGGPVWSGVLRRRWGARSLGCPRCGRGRRACRRGG